MGFNCRLFLFVFLVSTSVGNMLYGQDSIAKENSKLDFLNEIDQRNWRVKIPIWVPGFRGSFAYGGISTLPEGGDYNITDRLNGEIGVEFYLIGDIDFKPKKWFFGADGFRTTLASDLKFQNIDKIEFTAAIDGTILRGMAGYQAFESQNKEKHFKTQIYPYVGIRYIDLNIYSMESNILDIKPSWVEPLIGVEIPVQYRRWFFTAQMDVGGFSVNNHWSWNASINATYRFSKLFGLGAGWSYLEFNYDQEFEFDYLSLNIDLSGPVLSVEFNF